MVGSVAIKFLFIFSLICAVDVVWFDSDNGGWIQLILVEVSMKGNREFFQLMVGDGFDLLILPF